MNNNEESQGRHNEGFRSGVKLCFARHVWNKIKERVARELDLDLPVRYGDRTNVATFVDHTSDQYSKYERGGMPDRAMFTAMTGLGMTGADLDDLPHVDERLVAGFQLIVYRLSGGKDLPSQEDLIPVPVFMAIRALHRHFIRDDLNWKALTSADWGTLHATFAPTMIGGGEALMRAFEAWHEQVFDAIKGVDLSWIEDGYA